MSRRALKWRPGNTLMVVLASTSRTVPSGRKTWWLARKRPVAPAVSNTCSKWKPGSANSSTFRFKSSSRGHP